MKTIQVRSLAWVFGLALLAVIGAYFTGHVAIVSTSDFIARAPIDTFGFMNVSCQKTKYRAFGNATEIVAGRPSGLLESISGGTVTNTNFGTEAPMGATSAFLEYTSRNRVGKFVADSCGQVIRG
ncbi:MAG: hypothetical protein Q8P23_03535 [bacterium]|nr:hypothetical protein [bacterium]